MYQNQNDFGKHCKYLNKWVYKKDLIKVMELMRKTLQKRNYRGEIYKRYKVKNNHTSSTVNDLKLYVAKSKNKK